MTKLENTIQYIEDHDVKIIFRKNLNGLEAFALKLDVNDDGAIVIEEDNIRSALKTNTILLHEFSHLDYPKSMYDFETSIYARKRRENNINKHMIKKFIPVELLKRLLENGLQPFEISEELSIEEKTIKEAILLYKENGLLD